MKPADVHFYVDADILGLAKVLVAVRSDVTYPGFDGGKMHGRMRPSWPDHQHRHGRHWIPEVAQHNWLIITRDSAIQERRAEINALRQRAFRRSAAHLARDPAHAQMSVGALRPTRRPTTPSTAAPTADLRRAGRWYRCTAQRRS